MDSKPSILIVAAEASSSLYAQRLLETWNQRGIEVDAFGVGSQAMEALGFQCIGRAEEMAVVGLQEVLTNFSLIRSTFHQLLAEVDKRQTKVALLLDYPGFNLRIAKKLKARGIKVIYYISPQIWAWKKNRIKLIQKYVDLMLVLFPFEAEFYQQHGVPVQFVGHPLLDEISPDVFNHDIIQRERARYGFAEKDIVLGLMPGSRKSEIKHHLRTQIIVAKKLMHQYPQLKTAFLVAPTLDQNALREQLQEFDLPLVMIKKDPVEMLQVTDVILCASGTATLLTGLMQKPMVIMYKMNAFTAFWAKLLVTSTPFFGMVNLIFGRKIVPEYFQEEASVEVLSHALEGWISNQEARLKKAQELSGLKDLLGDKGATQRVTDAVSEYLT